MPNRKKVFVVHGRDHKAQGAMFDFLRGLSLEPLEWSQAMDLCQEATPVIWDVVTNAFAECETAVVLLTGDDEARLREIHHTEHDGTEETDLTPQARQNVLVELGVALALGRERTVVVQLGKIRSISDISGFHLHRMNDSPGARTELRRRLMKAGADVPNAGQDWLRAGKFDAAIFAANSSPREPETDDNRGDAFCPSSSLNEQVLVAVFNGDKSRLSLKSELGVEAEGHLDYALDELEAAELVDLQHSIVAHGDPSDPMCSITRAGRGLVLKRGLIT